MRGKIENLGDYNTARILLQEKNGDLSALIKEFKRNGALEALPKQLGIGLLIGVPVCLGGQYVIKKVSNYIKKRKKVKEKEKELEGELKAVLLADEEEPVLIKKDEEPLC